MSPDQNTNLFAVPAGKSNQRDDWADLRDITARTQHALKPVAPSPEFRARLRDGLRMAAYYREMRELFMQPRPETPWGLLVSAAALGSAAGLLALVLRVRQNPRAAEQVDMRECPQ